MQETPSEPVPASVPPFSQQRQDQGTRALQHTPSSGPAHARQDEQGETSRLLQSLPLPVKSVIGNEVGQAAGGHFRAAPSLAAW